MRALGRYAKRVGVNRAILSAWQMLRCVSRQAINRRNELKRRLRAWEAMTFHQVFGQQQTSDRRDDCYQQNTNGAFPLVQQTPHKREREFEVAHRQRVAQFEDHARARERHDFPYKIEMHCAIFSQENVDLLQLVFDLTRIAASEQYEQIQRILIELEFPFFRATPDDLCRFLLPTGSA